MATEAKNLPPMPTSEILKKIPTEAQIKEIKKASEIAAVIPAIFAVLTDILNRLDDMASKRDEAIQKCEKLEKTVEDLKIQLCDLQYESTKKKIRINGLPSIAGETTTQSMAKFDQLLEDLDLSPGECEYNEIFRIPAKQIPGKPKWHPTLVVEFKHWEDKMTFFNNVKHLKQLTQYKIFINDDYPKALVPKLKKLEKLAKAHRLNGLKTKINYQDGDLHLSTKSGTLAWKKQEFTEMIDSEEKM